MGIPPDILSGTIQIDTYGNFSYYFLPFPVLGQTFVTFSVVGCGSSCVLDVLLSNSSSSADPTAQTYQVDISASASRTTAYLNSPRGTRSGPLAFSSSYWVSWGSGVISVGAGLAAGKGTPLLSFTDPSPTRVAYVALSSGKSAVTYMVNIPGPA